MGTELAYISASIGITMYPRDGATSGDLLCNVDQAMYQSKGQSRNCMTYFAEALLGKQAHATTA